MNIFSVDNDPIKSAIHLNDKHVNKMIIESAQMLSTTHRLYGTSANLYKATHIQHPSTIWTRMSKANYNWLYTHFVALLNEYTHRYGRIHKTSFLLKALKNPPEFMPDIGLTPFALAIPDEYKGDDPVESYRKYYIEKKIQNKTWTNRREELDHWLTKHLEPKQFKRKEHG